jgi:general secretion pathway protein B
MSSILKALQKLEQEKSSRRQGAPDVAVDIAKPVTAKQRFPWLIPAAMAGVTLMAVLITYAAMGGFSRPKLAPVAVAPPVGTLPEKVTVSPTPAAVSPATTPPSPSMQLSISQKRQNKEVAPAPTGTVAPKSAPLTRQQVAIPPQSPPQTAPPVPVKVEQISSAAPLPALKVTGIAWDKDSSSRLAMVNGAAVAEGGTVGGARVEEIFQDRVRFTAGEKNFEVPLGKSSADR